MQRLLLLLLDIGHWPLAIGHTNMYITNPHLSINQNAILMNGLPNCPKDGSASIVYSLHTPFNTIMWYKMIIRIIIIMMMIMVTEHWIADSNWSMGDGHWGCFVYISIDICARIENLTNSSLSNRTGINKFITDMHWNCAEIDCLRIWFAVGNILCNLVNGLRQFGNEMSL